MNDMNKKKKALPPEVISNDICIRYIQGRDSLEWQILPADLCDTAPRTPAHPLIQIALRGQNINKLFSAGKTMRGHAPTEQLKFQSQEQIKDDTQTRIDTVLSGPNGLALTHSAGLHDAGVQVSTTAENRGTEPIEIDMLSSFCLGGITPFTDDDAPNRLRLHRFRSVWSGEGRHDAADIEDLHLERTWGETPVGLRYGQAGSLPVREYFPFIAIEDTQAGVFWGAMLAWHGSWQMECLRTGDTLSLSGGHGDFESAHWMKRLLPGETFTTPTALVTTCCGTLDDLCARLVSLQDRLAHPEPDCERNLPIVFNEWCSSWGKPTEDALLKTAEVLAENNSARYLVIDDGWAERPPEYTMQFNGDWNLSAAAFPNGLKPVCDQIRKHGLIPGIWFEFETCTDGSKAFALTDHQLKRHGSVLTVGTRRFWDFRDPWTFDYLRKKVIDLLRDNGFGYLKVDYNDCFGIGCDGAESLGEGLRQHLEKVQEFFQLIRRELPELVIENCASGGHRLEPGLVGLTSMSSFSDAHETPEIPILAASMHRLIPPHKSQIWAVLRAEHSLEKLRYVLSSAFLGRMCISGDLTLLKADQLQALKDAQDFYARTAEILRNGTSRIFRDIAKSYRHPTGWQIIVRHHANQCLIVFHGFAAKPDALPPRFPLPDGAWELTRAFGTPGLSIHQSEATINPAAEPFSGGAWLLTRTETLK